MDPDIPIPSVEAVNGDVNHSAPNLKINTSRSATVTTDVSMQDSSPSRTPFKTPRSHPSSPASRTASRSPSAASSRNVKRPAGLERKTSTPNLSTTRGTTPGHQVQYRRTSSVLNPATPTKPKVSSVDNFPQRQEQTPSSVAQEYFRKELKHNAEKQSKVALIVHDSCYGHRFARPRTTKSNLSLIVERPERIHATLLGACTAYVRLGDRHKDGKYGPHPHRNLSSVSSPPFDLRKTTRYIPLNHPAVVSVHGSKWMEELQIMCDSAEAKLSMNQKETSRPIGYGKDDKGKVLPPLHSGDLYLSQESLAALQGCLGGVCDAVDSVFQSEMTRRAFVCIRPPGHHCSDNVPSGFCWLNNVHIGITYAAMNHGLTHAAIIDFDLHHGDGSQTITWDHNSDALSSPKNTSAHKKIPIGYYSLHDINSFPCEWGDKEKVQNASLCIHQAHGQSIWNVHLEPWRNHEEFWHLYKTKYSPLLLKAQAFLRQHSDRLRSAGIPPKAAIFLSSGFDASQWEGEGMQRHKVNVPTEFYAKFTSDVVDLALQSDLGVDGRIVSVLEGGYSDRALTSGVLSHMCGLTHNTGTGSTMESISGFNGAQTESALNNPVPYDPAWWDVDSLEHLEAIVAGRAPTPKTKDKNVGSYSSPTHASTARMTEVARERRSLSAQMEARLLLENAPPEPAPEVDWVTACYELSQLLIPNDRQTKSFTHEELNAEATRARKERQSVLVPTTNGFPEEGRQLRDRKARPTQYDVVSTRPSSRGVNRRTTIANASDLPDPLVGGRSVERPRRRSSAASSVLSSFQDMKLEDKPQSRSSRPSSRQGSTGTVESGSGAAQKKARAAPKKAPSRTNSPRKPKAPAPAAQPPPTTRPKPKIKASANNDQVSHSTQASDTGDKTKDDVNELTNGMKKVSIKLNMPTEVQPMPNQKVGEPGKTSRPKVTRKPSVHKTMKGKVSTSDAAAASVAESHAPAASNLAQPSSNALQHARDKPGTQQVPASALSLDATKEVHSLVSGRPETEEASSSIASSLPTATIYQASSSMPTQSITSEAATETNNSETSKTSVQSRPEQPLSATELYAQPQFGEHLPPKANAAFIAPRPRTELPTFTSTSTIPFSGKMKPSQPNQDNKENTGNQELQQGSVWDIPETPQK